MSKNSFIQVLRKASEPADLSEDRPRNYDLNYAWNLDFRGFVYVLCFRKCFCLRDKTDFYALIEQINELLWLFSPCKMKLWIFRLFFSKTRPNISIEIMS